MNVDISDREISAATLRRYFDVIMAHLEDTGRTTFPLTDDYYWDVATSAMYDVYKEPSTRSGGLTIGDLSENLEFLDRCVEDPEHTILYALVWLSQVLKAVGSGPEFRPRK